MPKKKEMVRPRNILSKVAKGRKIFLGTLSGIERMRRVEWVDATPEDYRAWTCRWSWVLVGMGRGEAGGLLL